MADENIVTNIVANADFSNLIADVNKVTASLSKLQQQIISADAKLTNQVAAINRAFSENLRRTGQFSTHFVTLSSEAAQFGKNLDSGQLKLKQYFKTFQDHTKTSGGVIRDLAKQQVALQNAIIQPLGKNAQGLMQFNVQVPQGLDNIKSKTALARQELQILNKVVQDGGVQLINWGKNTQWAGRQLTVGLTVPLAAFGKAAADAFKLADQELVRLTKVYGGLAATSTAELGKVRNDVSKTAADIAKAYGVSFKDTIALAADIAATGKTGNELLGSIQQTSRLAVLGEVDRQEAMKATLALQNAFKQNTEELTQSIDFLNAVENQTSTTLGDLIEAIPRAGTVVHGMGGSVKDLALYLTAMKEGGVNAAEGANALKSALASLINPTKVATGMFTGFGIDLKGIVAKNAGDLTGTILELQKALDTLDPLKKQQAIEQLFGKFQFARMNALFENLGRQGSQTLQVLDLMKASSQDLANIAGRELSQVTESASGKYRRALEGLKADLAGVGEQFLKINTTLINVVDGILKFINKLPTPIKSALGFIGGLTALAGPLIMLTGVLANFFGYIIKGVAHFKSLFRGGEGWKLLTPEIIAASKAGNLVEKTFYSDAKAASVLKLALEGLVAEYSILEQKSKAGAVGVAPTISTVAGNTIIAGGQRQVDPNHPMTGKMDTRDFSHVNPVGQMTTSQKQMQTIFGVVPGSESVNSRVSNNPQMYMNKDMPRVPGLTEINGASTGIVAAEAAKWHAMTGALAMQSQAEIKLLKTEVAQTGLITSELSASYQALLPEMTRLTTQAATESAAIVAEMQAGKINVDQAMLKIRTLNAEIEAMMGQSATAIATAQGRNINLTNVPLLNQPIVNSAGKSNLKELSRPGRTRGLLNKIAGNLGVKTFGAGYSMETTIPKKFAGGVTALGMALPRIASGPARARMLDLLRSFSAQSGRIGGSRVPSAGQAARYLAAQKGERLTSSGRGASTAAHVEVGAGKTFREFSERNGDLYNDPEIIKYGITPTIAGRGAANQVLVHGNVPRYRKMTKDLETLPGQSTPIIPGSQLGSRNMTGKTDKPYVQLLPSQFVKNSAGFNKKLNSGVATSADWVQVKGEDMVSLRYFLKEQGVSVQSANIISQRAADVLNNKIANASGPITETMFGDMLNQASIRGIRSAAAPMMSQAKFSANSKDPFWGRGNLEPTKYASGVTRVAGYGGGDVVPALIEPGESVVTKEATAGNEGAISFMNAGGKIPGFAGGITAAFTGGVKNPYGKGMGSSIGKIPQMGLGAQMGIGMVGQMAGQMIPGPIGNAISMASWILPMMTMGKSLSGIIPLAVKLASILGRLTIPGAVVGGLLLVGKAIGAIKKSNDEAAAANAMFYGQTEKTSAALGIKYTNLGKTIDSVKQKLEDQKSAGAAAYASVTSSGVPGLTLTITQLRELKAQVKKDVPEMINAFNKIDSTKVNELAQSLKAQFIEGGKSVEEATKLIYALVSASDKATQAVAAIGNEGFKAITDNKSAADFLLNNITKLIDGTSKFDANAFGGGINTLLNGLEAGVDSLTKMDKDGKSLNTEFEAVSKTFEQIGETGAKNAQVGQKGVEAIKAQNLQLGLSINKTDTLSGIWAKTRLLLSGVQGDLSKISSANAEMLASFQAALDTASANYQSTGSEFSGLSAAAAKLDAQAKRSATYAQTAGATQAATSKQKLKAIDAEIKRINDLADAEKKRLQGALDESNAENDIQKEQLAYRQAIARGDMDAAAAAQLRIAQLSKQFQTSKALEAVEDRRQKALDIQNKKKDSINEASDATATSITNSGKKATDLAAQSSALKQFISEMAGLATQMGKANEDKKRGLITPEDYMKIRQSIEGNQVTATANAKKAGLSSYLSEQGFIDKKGNPVLGNFANNYNSKLDTAGAGIVNLASDIIGKEGKTLSDIWAVMAKMAGVKGMDTPLKVSNIPVKTGKGVTAQDNYLSGTTVDINGLKSAGVKPTDRSGGYSKAKFTDASGVEWIVGDPIPYTNSYRVTKANPGSNFNYPGRAQGGRVMSGQSYLVGERGMEIFKPDLSGSIVPNHKLGASYNIPSGAYSMPQGGVNSSYNNNTYTISISLNGTNVTADEVVAAFEQKMAKINAKQGLNRSLGNQGVRV